MALMDAFVTFRAVSADDRPLRAMDSRLSWVLMAGRDGWKIVHEHTSVPLDPQSGQAMMTRG